MSCILRDLPYKNVRTEPKKVRTSRAQVGLRVSSPKSNSVCSVRLGSLSQFQAGTSFHSEELQGSGSA